MSKKLVAPFIAWTMFLVLGISSLLKGIAQHESWRITAAGLALMVATAFLFFIVRYTAKELKAVRVRK